jgi:AraC family transcriptional activator of tynA and feaB
LENIPLAKHRFALFNGLKIVGRVRMPNRSDRSIKPVRIAGNAEEWRAGLSKIFVELEFEQVDPAQRLVGLMYTYPFGDVGFVRAITRGGPHRVIRSQRTIDASSHNNFFIGCMLAGRANLSQAGHIAALERGDLAILDSTRHYEIDVPNSFDALWVRVPRYRIEGRLASIEQVISQRINGSAGIGHLASNMLRSALREAPRITPADANRITNSLLDLLGMSLACDFAAAPSQARGSHSTLRRIQRYIEDHLDDEGLSLETIAAAHAVSTRYINKLFEREGISAARWLRLRRLERCRADLENPEKRVLSISEIAFNHGFGNISSFNRAFKARFKVAPTALRSA